MAGSGPLPPWEALEAFRTGPEFSVAYPAEMGKWEAVKKAAKSAEFKAAVANLEQSQAPSAYRGKNAFVQSLKDLIQAAETGSVDEVKTKYLTYKEASVHLVQ